nr:uncharacterized protein LOC111518074 [Leptinotarsa decemlineata]
MQFPKFYRKNVMSIHDQNLYSYDYLLSIYRSCCFEWVSADYTIKFLLLKSLLSQLVCTFGSFEIFYNGSMDSGYVPFLILLQMSTVMYLVGASTVHQLRKSPKIVQMQAWPWTLAGDKTFRKLLLEAKEFRRVCLAIFCSTTISFLLFLPLLGDEQDWQFLVFMWNEYTGNRMYILFLTCYIFVLLILGIFITSLICVSLYCVRHVEFQFKILNALICKLHTSSNNLLDDVRCQEQVDDQLKCCIRVHVEIRKVYKLLMASSNSLVLALTAYGLVVFVFAVYFIMLDVSPRSNLRIYLMIMTACVVLWSFCEYCQRLTNESEIVFLNACKCPWEQFNVHNRRTLLMLLLNTGTPITVSCHGVLDANYPLAVKMWRMAYATITLFTNLS